MKLKIRGQIKFRQLALILGAVVALAGLMWFRLGGLTDNKMTPAEVRISVESVGWHGIYYHPLGLPVDLIRSVVFWLQPDHGVLLSRLPNTIFGIMSVLIFAWLVYMWHGRRTAWLATCLFACGAWTLHVSRLATDDVLYLWAGLALLAAQFALQQYGARPFIRYAALLLSGALLYVPGMIWLLVIGLWLQWPVVKQLFRSIKGPLDAFLSLLALAVWLPLLIIDLLRPGQLAVWLGLPEDWSGPLHYLKEFAVTLGHLLVRGPQYPEVWLDRLPILDIFVLAACLIGSYFYVTKWRSRRSRSLGSLFIAGVVLVTLGGPVSLSLLVPFLYLAAATGLAYLSHDWLKVFPRNPLARGLGIGLISLAVAASCFYNLRSYFIAWPHSATTKAVFNRR